MLLALAGGTIAESGSAFAQPPNACTQTCPAHPAPSGVDQQDWNAAIEAADFWANYEANHLGATVAYTPSERYWRLDHTPGHGWPSAGGGGVWYAYWDRHTQNYEYVYYGGRFNDSQRRVTRAENRRGVANTNAFPTAGTRSSPYVEYDIDYYDDPHDPRNARRIVRNTRTGHVYATFDHYNTFYYLGRY
ncbi:ribonuclease domain-containing protein [Streptomyces scabiei]|uniref:ribonuclease domain-containing protein n=1 Tax=Streptomyces scabiei TaxID=1930 RepID=UPI0029BC1E5A|nr:ribonuclease domain-containing protein [Streptomyces scabiei]MDX3517917.1 ribonuclease domain-containing protein [Streptomyces scabiei]